MHRLSNNRAVVWTGALVAVVLVAVTAAAVTFASNQARKAAVPPLSNGGARQWVSFDPEGREIGPVQFLSKIVRIANTSTATNRFTIYYEPAHTPICVGTLGAGQAFLCGVQPTTHLSGGYFQVIAAQPVLMGGHSDVPVLAYAQNPNGTFGATSTGTIQNMPLVWQQGCPPRRGSGCPEHALSNGGVNKVGAKR